MSNWFKRLLYGYAFQIPTYVAVWWVTDNVWIAGIAGLVSFWLAADDWESAQRRKAAQR